MSRNRSTSSRPVAPLLFPDQGVAAERRVDEADLEAVVAGHALDLGGTLRRAAHVEMIRSESDHDLDAVVSDLAGVLHGRSQGERFEHPREHGDLHAASGRWVFGGAWTPAARRKRSGHSGGGGRQEIAASVTSPLSCESIVHDGNPLEVLDIASPPSSMREADKDAVSGASKKRAIRLA